MSNENELYQHLQSVIDDTKRKIAWYKKRIEEKPPKGKNRDGWRAYWYKQISDADIAAHYCLMRQMQIEPD